MESKTSHSQCRRDWGAIYTPEFLGLWLATEVKDLGFRPTIVIDPAAGAGALIQTALKVFPEAKVQAFELDPNAHEQLMKLWPNKTSHPGDSLKVKTWLEKDSKEVLIYSNPPWGARISKNSDSFYRKNFESAKGLYDTFDVFLEKSISELPDNSWGAFFVPDSILLMQHKTVRRIILENTEIKSVTRLPEGTFEGVAMGVITLIVKKTKPKKNNVIRVSRIDRNAFRKLKGNMLELQKELRRREHSVKQTLWSNDPNLNWVMEFKKSNSLLQGLSIFSGLNGTESTWDSWFETGRGLEIGKKSNHLIQLNGKASSRTKRYVAVGEDVNRLQVRPSRYINLEIPEFNYKKELGNQERLLIRKTGIGIKAVVAAGISTTQTIYHFVPKKTAPNYALYYAAGFLISRVVIALHLAKTGETEWRSHPYVTQKTIKELNLPKPKRGSSQEKIAKEIACVTKLLHKNGSKPNLEMKLDSLVCELIGASSDLKEWSYKFLYDIQGCSYTKELISDIFNESRAA